MSDIFGTSSGFLDWSLNNPVGIYTTAQASQPNGASVPVNRPSVDTGGTEWGQWFDRIVGGAVAVRNAWGGDARVTAYPGSPGYAPQYAGQPAPVADSGIPSWLILAGFALAAVYVLRG